MYMCTDILYNFSTIDDFKDSVAVVASEQRVESGNYDKGYNKKPENRFLKHVSGLAEVFFFFSNSSYCKHHQNSMIQSVRHFETLMTNLCKLTSKLSNLYILSHRVVDFQAVRRHPAESAYGQRHSECDSNAHVCQDLGSMFYHEP